MVWTSLRAGAFPTRSGAANGLLQPLSGRLDDHVGKWGARYQVNADDFQRFPNSLGDEEKVYLYFGNTNKLLRVYSAIRKVDGWNRYKQINVILNKKYTFSDLNASKGTQIWGERYPDMGKSIENLYK